jgi:bifunctional ADP-heptose synthase (sugar kinase/adenylyltransferase)
MGYKPDILVIGEEYKNNYIVGKSIFSEIKYFNRVPNKSTTLILNYGKTNSM